MIYYFKYYPRNFANEYSILAVREENINDFRKSFYADCLDDTSKDIDEIDRAKALQCIHLLRGDHLKISSGTWTKDQGLIPAQYLNPTDLDELFSIRG